MASNYPDGMSEGDIPGYWDTECPECEEHWAETGESEFDECETCGGTGVVDIRGTRDYEP